MGSKDDLLNVATMGGYGLVKGVEDPAMPEIPEPPPPVEDVDVSGQKDYTKSKLKSRKGRQSTILASLGSGQQTGKKTILG